jgi:hypothetical protein
MDLNRMVSFVVTIAPSWQTRTSLKTLGISCQQGCDRFAFILAPLPSRVLRRLRRLVQAGEVSRAEYTCGLEEPFCVLMDIQVHLLLGLHAFRAGERLFALVHRHLYLHSPAGASVGQHLLALGLPYVIILGASLPLLELVFVTSPPAHVTLRVGGMQVAPT